MSIISHQIGKPFGAYPQDESFMPKLRRLAIESGVPESYLRGVYVDLRSSDLPFIPDVALIYVESLFASVYSPFLERCKEIRIIRPDLDGFIDNLIEGVAHYRIGEVAESIDELFSKSNEEDPYLQILLALLLSRALILKADPVFYEEAVRIFDEADVVYESVDPELAKTLAKSRMFAKHRAELMSYWIRLYPDPQIARRYIAETFELLGPFSLEAKALAARENLLLQMGSALFVCGLRVAAADTGILKAFIHVNEELIKLYQLAEDFKKSFNLRFTTMQYSALIAMLDYDTDGLEEALRSFDEIDLTRAVAIFPQIEEAIAIVKDRIAKHLQMMQEGGIIRITHAPWLDFLVSRQSRYFS